MRAKEGGARFVTVAGCRRQDWERCERGIAGSLEKLRAFKRQLSQPLPDHHEDLQAEQMRCKVSVKPDINSLIDIELFREQVVRKRKNLFVFLLLLLQELENTFDGWTGDLSHLTVLRESLSCYISAEDLSVLQERIELLHRQWDEICHQVQPSAAAVIISGGDLDFLQCCVHFAAFSLPAVHPVVKRGSCWTKKYCDDLRKNH